jgi:hypothetical protein
VLEVDCAAGLESSQAVASGSNICLEDLEEGKINNSFWKDRYEQEDS